VSIISFRETKSGGAFAPHDAPTRQFVITLAGALEFKTAKQESFIIHPGDILLAEDTTGSGHSWRLIDASPWRRAYIILAPDVAVPFRKTGSLTQGQRPHLVAERLRQYHRTKMRST
jgi:quercetin dioxygenase-like cupin family protein